MVWGGEGANTHVTVESGKVGEWDSGRVGACRCQFCFYYLGEWEIGRVGEWESGGGGEWESGCVQM